MTPIGTCGALLLAIGPALCAVGAQAADMPVKAPPSAADAPPKSCTDSWAFLATNCQLIRPGRA